MSAPAIEPQRRIAGGIATLATLLEAGLSPRQALRRASSQLNPGDDADRRRAAPDEFLRDFSAALLRAARADEVGEGPADVFLAAAEKAPAPWLARIYGELYMCFRLSSENGVPAASMLRSHAQTCQSRCRAEGTLQSALAGPESTARLLTWLPAVGAGFGLVLLGPDWLDAAISPLGLTALGAAAVLVIAGRRWSSAILARARKVEVLP